MSEQTMSREKQFSREIHNMTDTRLYNVWNNIKRRCYTKTNPSYKYYGGCGVKMCEEWRKSFKSFYEWALNNGYNENAPKGECTIDRIDCKGNYEPSNCRWVSMKEQNLNRSANKIIEYNGIKRTLKEWSDILNFNYSTLLYRLRRGWSVERALTEGVHC
jgi:hypothetical protein